MLRRAVAMPACLFEIVGGLQIEPELGRGAEALAEQDRRFRGDRACPCDDLGDAIGRKADFSRERAPDKPSGIMNSVRRTSPGVTGPTRPVSAISEKSSRAESSKEMLIYAR